MVPRRDHVGVTAIWWRMGHQERTVAVLRPGFLQNIVYAVVELLFVPLWNVIVVFIHHKILERIPEAVARRYEIVLPPAIQLHFLPCSREDVAYLHGLLHLFIDLPEPVQPLAVFQTVVCVRHRG